MPRPTDYSEEVLIKTREYIDGDAIVPTVAGLSGHLGVARSTIYDWASQEDKKEFSDIIESLLSKQEEQLIAKGLSGKFNPTITKLILTKHGYSDKQEIDQNLKGEVQFVNGVPRPKE